MSPLAAPPPPAQRATRTPRAAAALGILATLGGIVLPQAEGAQRASHPGAQLQLILSHGHVRGVPNRFLSTLGPWPDAPSRTLPRTSTATASDGPPSGTAARSARSRGPTVAAALGSLQRAGALGPPAYQQYLGEYQSAMSALRRLRGTRRNELGAVLTNVQDVAAAGRFTPSRLPALFLTLQRNQQWWTTGPLLGTGQRVGFPGSGLVWQYYPGQGIEIQWLGTFGEANGYYSSGDSSDLRRVLDEAVALASARAGGVAWEYLFRFDGGRPPWTSGLSQGTGIQALARAWSRLHTEAYLSTAQTALGIFQTAPPEGVRVPTAAGAHYLEYSYAPRERILNGFIQSLVGLYDYTHLTRDPLGEQLFAAGDAQARVETPTYDTGAWSLYDQFGESDLSYHQLLTQFLANLCARTQTSPTPLSSSSGSAAPHSNSTYCATAQHFQSYETSPPALTVLSTRLLGGRPALLRYRLSKISTVTVTVRRQGTSVFTLRSLAAHGLQSVSWTPPARGGTYTLTLYATDLAGNSASAQRALVVSASAPAPRRPRH